MQRQRQAVAATGCDRCPAFRVKDASTVRARHFSVIPSRLAAQVTDGVWNAVVTTAGKGTFLIRRPKDLPDHACPLRAYEIRYIEAEAPLVQKETGGRQTVGRGKRRAKTCANGLAQDNLYNKRGA